ncbi:FUSC family protein [Modestobacter sp. NPDC049651]|uniref:FUSC family protein n=1 Tax=unclassified Modestobacter TaxID=2643866 RepID=UPI0033C914E5
MTGQLREVARHVVAVRPVPADPGVALRAGISVLVPLLTVLALDHPAWALYAAFGAFTSLYGRTRVHLSRLAMQASAGTALTASVVAGALVGVLDARAWVAVGVAALIAAGGSALATTQDWHPPGPLFLVFAFGAASSVPHQLSDVPVAAAVAAASAVFALVVGNTVGLVRAEPTRPTAPRPVPRWQPVRAAVAVVVAGLTATAVGIGHPYWAMVAAVAPLSAPGVTHQVARAGQRVIGTLAGLLTAAVLLAPGFSAVTTVLVVVVLQVVTELLIGRNYAIALLFITPMALLMGQVAAPRPMGPLLFDRGVETVIGAALGLLVIWVGTVLRRRGQQPA